MSLLTSAPRRGRLLNDTVLGASPDLQRTMLCDRLVRDLDQAGQAQAAGNRSEANAHFSHAQEIVSGLMVALDTRGREAGAGLSSLYTHFLSELVRANLTHDADRTAACQGMVESLRAAWLESTAGLNAPAAVHAVHGVRAVHGVDGGPAGHTVHPPVAVAIGRRTVGLRAAARRSRLRLTRASRLMLGRALAIPLVNPATPHPAPRPAPRPEGNPTR